MNGTPRLIPLESGEG